MEDLDGDPLAIPRHGRASHWQARRGDCRARGPPLSRGSMHRAALIWRAAARRRCHCTSRSCALLQLQQLEDAHAAGAQSAGDLRDVAQAAPRAVGGARRLGCRRARARAQAGTRPPRRSCRCSYEYKFIVDGEWMYDIMQKTAVDGNVRGRCAGDARSTQEGALWRAPCPPHPRPCRAPPGRATTTTSSTCSARRPHSSPSRARPRGCATGWSPPPPRGTSSDDVVS